MSSKKYWYRSYPELFNLKSLESEIWLGDHLGGFDANRQNKILDHLHSIVQDQILIWHDQIPCDTVKQHYPKFQFATDFPSFIWDSFVDYRQHPDLDYQNFVCSFNGSAHVSRQLLTAALHTWNWFDPAYSSKNFQLTTDNIDGHISELTGNHSRFYQKFFINQDSDGFLSNIHTFGHVRFDHKNNIYNLQNQITKSFVHLVSECMATSYVPYVSEKFLYSVVTRGLFVAYAQPRWHHHLLTYYGFKPYMNIFNYAFDQIENPVHRLVELMCMLSKFKNLSPTDWIDLYEMEVDTVEYNYDHYFSGNYKKIIETHTQVHYETVDSRR